VSSGPDFGSDPPWIGLAAYNGHRSVSH